MMRTDSEIERDEVEELKWNPDLDSTDIAVTVKDGVVTLAGFVKSYVDKTEAEVAAKRVAGVVAVANDIAVRLPATDERTDPEIAREAVASLRESTADLGGADQGRGEKRVGHVGGHSRVALPAQHR